VEPQRGRSRLRRRPHKPSPPGLITSPAGYRVATSTWAAAFLRGWAGTSAAETRPGLSARSGPMLGQAVAVCGHTPQTLPCLGLEARRLRRAPPAGPDQPQRNSRRPPAQPALAGPGRTPPVKDVGEPCAGEPHARFDGRELESGCHRITAPAPDPAVAAGSARSASGRAAPAAEVVGASAGRRDTVRASPCRGCLW
jgi:hypothetical protein